MMIKVVISDFDGTLVDTFEANYQAYALAFEHCSNNIKFTRERYRQCFGLRFDAFMDAMGVNNESIRKIIRNEKARVYPLCFKSLIPNRPLIDFLFCMKASGVKLAIASTARMENLMNVLNYLKLNELFSLVLAGDQVKVGKPNPEIYVTAMRELNVSPEEVLIFEDSEVGIQAAEACGANVIRITNEFFNYEV